MQNLEALVRNVLNSISFDIFFQELELGLIGLDRVGQIISVDFLGLLSQERSDSFDTGRALHILGIDQFVEILFHFLSGAILQIHFIKHFDSCASVQ